MAKFKNDVVTRAYDLSGNRLRPSNSNGKYIYFTTFEQVFANDNNALMATRKITW